jgi:FkbM family methyltransferase
MTFLDIGANVGYYTALALRMSDGEGRIVALEPDPNSFEYLEQTVKRNGGLNTTCVPKAAGVRRDRLPLYLSKDNRGDNRLYEHEFQTETCLVEVAPVDELLDELGIDTVDLIKIDVQGYEGHVVRGMASAIRHSDQLVIMMEFWPDGLRRAGSDPLGLLRTLREWGLTLFMLTPGGSLIPVPDDQTLIERFPGRRYTNLVAVKGMDRAY